MLLTGAPRQTVKPLTHCFLVVELLDRFVQRHGLFDFFDILVCPALKGTYNSKIDHCILIIDEYRVECTVAQLLSAVEYNYYRHDLREFLERSLSKF